MPTSARERPAAARSARSARPRRRSLAGGPSWRRIGATIGALCVVVVLAVTAFEESADPRLALGEVSVLGAKRTSTASIVDAAALRPGANVWLLDVGAAGSRISALPWIRTVSVRRAWPNRVTIAVTERTPALAVALADDGSAEEPVPRFAVLDATMRVLDVAPDSGADGTVPLIRLLPVPDVPHPGDSMAGSAAERAYDAFVQLRALGLAVTEVDFAPATGFTVTATSGIRAMFGTADDIAEKVDLFRSIAPKIAQPQDVVYVDLRSVRAPTVLYR